MKKLGLDIGSTTIKCVVLDEDEKIIYRSYERHLSKIAERLVSTSAVSPTKQVRLP